MPQPCTVIIFGASGDLTYRKLIPAIYNIAADGDLPAALSVVGFARREKTDEQFRTELEEAARKYSRQGVNDELWKSFANRVFYHRSEFGDIPADVPASRTIEGVCKQARGHYQVLAHIDAERVEHLAVLHRSSHLAVPQQGREVMQVPAQRRNRPRCH